MSKANITVDSFIRVLNDEKIYPVQSNWNMFEIKHPKSKPDLISEKEQITKIRNEVGDKKGLYCYYNNENKCLYVGKANPLYNRIKSHYRESFTLNEGKSHQWNEFFAKHADNHKVYWIEIEDEDLRVICERLIALLEKPLFEETTPRVR